MSETRMRRLTAGLGGMALALVLIGLVVQHARATSPECQTCQRNATREAMETHCSPFDPNNWQSRYCVQTYMMTKCFGGMNPVCPGVDADGDTRKDCGSTGCRFVENSEGTCQNDGKAGTICSDNCYAQPCGAAGSGSTCRDVHADLVPGKPLPTNTLCYTKCGCQ